METPSMSSIHACIWRLQLSCYLSSVCIECSSSMRSSFWCNLKRVLSCLENHLCAENSFQLGVETWVTTRHSYSKTGWLSENHLFIVQRYFWGGCICINVFLKLKQLWTFLHTFQKVLKEPNNKYLLNILSELTSGPSQWRILEKDEQRPYPI